MKHAVMTFTRAAARHTGTRIRRRLTFLGRLIEAISRLPVCHHAYAAKPIFCEANIVR